MVDQWPHKFPIDVTASIFQTKFDISLESRLLKITRRGSTLNFKQIELSRFHVRMSPEHIFVKLSDARGQITIIHAHN